MFEQINEQLKNSFKPVTEIAALNMSTLQDLAEKQSSLYSTLLADGMSFFETAGQQKDVMSLAEAQKAYAEQLQGSVTDAAKEAYTVLTGAQQKATEMVKGMSEEYATAFTAAK